MNENEERMCMDEEAPCPFIMWCIHTYMHPCIQAYKQIHMKFSSSTSGQQLYIYIYIYIHLYMIYIYSISDVHEQQTNKPSLSRMCLRETQERQSSVMVQCGYCETNIILCLERENSFAHILRR
jgi:hypothetical protein